jgi:hypothetical protein
MCCRPFRLAVPQWFHHGLVSTSRSSNRTGRFPASGSRTRLHASRATPSAASEHLLELIGFPISRSFTPYCVCLELRCLPSTGVTRLQRTTNLSATPGRAACPSRASGWSLLTTLWGFPCCVRFSCVHAAVAQRLNVSLRSFHPDVSVFPDRVVGSTCALFFSRLARRSLALRPAHSRCHQFVTR